MAEPVTVGMIVTVIGIGLALVAVVAVAGFVLSVIAEGYRH